MKKSLKAVIAMILVLSFGFLMLSTTAFAATASEISAPQTAKIGDFFRALFKKISDSVKTFFSKLRPSTPPEEEETDPAQGQEYRDVVIIDDEYSGKQIGEGDLYAGGIW